MQNFINSILVNVISRYNEGFTNLKIRAQRSLRSQPSIESSLLDSELSVKLPRPESERSSSSS